MADAQFAYAPGEETLGNKEFKAYVIKLCVEDGINAATAQVQFGKWKKVQEGQQSRTPLLCNRIAKP